MEIFAEAQLKCARNEKILALEYDDILAQPQPKQCQLNHSNLDARSRGLDLHPWIVAPSTPFRDALPGFSPPSLGWLDYFTASSAMRGAWDGRAGQSEMIFGAESDCVQTERSAQTRRLSF